jgi:glycosyltransferase involved in cell wall biosynthesis
LKKVMVASFDMEVGGVERSLLSMLDHFDYDKHQVDVMLYRHQGDFLHLINTQARVLEEIPQYTTFRKSISETIRDKHYRIGLSRIASKLQASMLGKLRGISEPGYYQMQLMWKYTMACLPEIQQEYDTAISYLWPHDFVAGKVKAKKKVAWIHTDYTNVETDIALDLQVWRKFDHIIAVSDACKDSFLHKYGELADKVEVIENITAPGFIKHMAGVEFAEPMTADSRFKLLTVARLSHAKGIDQAIRAMKLLMDRGQRNIVWYVVGYGGDEESLRGLITELGVQEHVILLGKKTNPYPYIRACDLYVQPSRYEGKAVTVTEAKILGRPVLITNYSTASSQVEHLVDGVICELSVEGIADGIERLWKEELLRRRLAEYCASTDYSNSYELQKLYKLS